MSGPPSEGGLSGSDRVRLAASATFYTVARALRIKSIKELLVPAQISPDKELWVLGERYAPGGDQDAIQKAYLVHFGSLQWISYRSNFQPIGASQLRTDAGWGCTLRSAQMMVAQGLQRALLGRGWRASAVPDAPTPKGLLALLRCFWDAPSHRYPLSIHNLCLHGANVGILPGKWLGPSAACRAIEAAWEAAEDGVKVPVEMHVLQANGSVPVLHVARFKSVWNSVDLTSSVISTGAPDVLEGDDTTDVTITTTDAMLGGSGRTSAAGDSSDAEAIEQIAVVDGKDVESSLGTSPIRDGWMLEPDAAAATSSSGSDAATASSTPASVDPRETDDEESANADKGAGVGEAGGGVIVGKAHEVTNPCGEGNERVGFEEAQAVPAGDISGPGEGERTEVVETTNEITGQTVGSSRMETSVAGDVPSVVALQDIGGKLAGCALRAGEPKNACVASQDATSEADKPASKPELVHAVGGCTPPGGASPFVAAAQPSDSKTPVAATAGAFDGASADAAVEAFAEARADGPGRSSAASEEAASQDADLPPPVHGLVILVPLVLGIGTLSEAYVPQLKEVLSMPQCIGIVGGRPSSSLYFIGFQEDNIVYLDPHHVQTAACSDDDWRTFCASSVSSMPICGIDPSMALGFYCGSKDEYEDLCERLSALESKFRATPLVSVSPGTFASEVYLEREPSAWEPDDLTSEDDATLDDDTKCSPEPDAEGNATREDSPSVQPIRTAEQLHSEPTSPQSAADPLASSSSASHALAPARSGWELL